MAKVLLTPEEWAGLMPCFSNPYMVTYKGWGIRLGESTAAGDPIEIPNETIIGILEGTSHARCGPEGWRGTLVRALASWVNLPDRDQEAASKERIAELEWKVGRLEMLRDQAVSKADKMRGWWLDEKKNAEEARQAAVDLREQTCADGKYGWPDLPWEDEEE